MQIAQLIKYSLDACDLRELDKALHFACLAVDGTATKLYPELAGNGNCKKRFTRFIGDHMDIIELMFGGIDFRQTIFPFKSAKGKIGLKFEDIVYEKFRCSFAHGNELPEGFGLTAKVEEFKHEFTIDFINCSMTFPESSIFALGLPCVLSPANFDQNIGADRYYYHDRVNEFIIDSWWGKLDQARAIMNFENQVKITIDFSNVWPS